MSFQDLPIEVKAIILPLCSKSTLASLARLDKSISLEAEKELYRVINARLGRDYEQGAADDDSARPGPVPNPSHRSHTPSLAPLAALSQNKQKASMVQYLSLDYFDSSWWYNNLEDDERFDSSSTLSVERLQLLEALRNLTSLIDLRIVISGRWNSPLHRQLADVISAGNFKLQTLCCPDDLGIATIIRGQPNLRFLGLYPSHGLRFLHSPTDMASSINTVLASGTSANWSGSSLLTAHLTSWDPENRLQVKHPARTYPSSVEFHWKNVDKVLSSSITLDSNFDLEDSSDSSILLQSILASAFNTHQSSPRRRRKLDLVLSSAKVIRLKYTFPFFHPSQAHKARVLVQAAAATFPNLAHLELTSVQDATDAGNSTLDLTTLTNILALLPDLETLGIFLPTTPSDDDDDDDNNHANSTAALNLPVIETGTTLTSWEMACPKLRSVTLPDGTTVIRRGPSLCHWTTSETSLDDHVHM